MKQIYEKYIQLYRNSLTELLDIKTLLINEINKCNNMQKLKHLKHLQHELKAIEIEYEEALIHWQNKIKDDLRYKY